MQHADSVSKVINVKLTFIFLKNEILIFFSLICIAIEIKI